MTLSPSTSKNIPGGQYPADIKTSFWNRSGCQTTTRESTMDPQSCPTPMTCFTFS